jgi:hypothetical protein
MKTLVVFFRDIAKLLCGAFLLVILFAAHACFGAPYFIAANETSSFKRIDFTWYEANGVGSAQYFSVVAAPASTTAVPIPAGYYSDAVGSSLTGHPGSLQDGQSYTWVFVVGGYEAVSKAGIQIVAPGISEPDTATVWGFFTAGFLLSMIPALIYITFATAKKGITSTNNLG